MGKMASLRLHFSDQADSIPTALRLLRGKKTCGNVNGCPIMLLGMLDSVVQPISASRVDLDHSSIIKKTGGKGCPIMMGFRISDF
jgi:hypothetical protein